MPRPVPTVCFTFTVAVVCLFPQSVHAGPETPPNWVPEMGFSYVDPVSGERIRCQGDCRRFDVPAGIDLEVRVRARDLSDDPSDEPVSWELWFDEPRRPFAGLDLSVCRSDDDGVVDEGCWLAMVDRIDWDRWREKTAERTCVPVEPGDCFDETVVVPLRSDFKGSRGRGVYAFMVWIDRFGVHAESDEFDNVAGPVRIRVAQTTSVDGARAGKKGGGDDWTAAIFAPRTPKPFGFRVRKAEIEEPFAFGSRVARADLDFVVRFPGPIEIEVEQLGAWEAMTVSLRKVSTGETLFETSGKGPQRIVGDVGKIHLKDDRRLVVEVRPGHGTRGLRGTIRVSYPDRGVYIRGE